MSWGALLQHSLHFCIFLFYCAAALCLYRWAFPLLVPSARVLASIFLWSQALTLIMGETLQPPNAFARWFWHLNEEWNFPSTLAATQYALVGVLALCIVAVRWRSLAWRCVYFVGVAAFFIYLGVDEYFMLHEWNPNWKVHYAALGVVLVVSTVVVFRRSPKRLQRFSACIPIGLAIAASGAIVFDFYSFECQAWHNIVVFNECVEVLTMEESLESLGIWVALLGALGIFSNLSPLPKRRHGQALYGLPAVLVLLLLSSGAVPPVSDQKGDEGSALLETGAQLHGFEIKRSGHAIEVHLFLSPSGLDFNGLGYSVSLVDQVSLDVLATRNSFARKQLNFLIAPGYIPVWRQWTELILPDDAPSNHAFWIALKFWQEKAGGFPTIGFEQSDLPLWNDSQIILDASVLKARTVPDASHASLAIFDSRFVLNAVELPPRAQAGEVLRATMSWRVETAGTYDWIQFLHFLHEESGEWFVYDQQPLGARLPTRLWYSDLADSETWEVPLPAGLAPGRYAVFTGLYRLSDKERVAATDASGKPYLDARVPLGSLIVTNEG